MTFKYTYFITSIRADRRNDERMNKFQSNNVYNVGDVITLDGLDWTVEQVGETAVKQPRIWTEEEIKNLVQTNDKVLYGALKNLYACQTADEQSMGETNCKNGAGFNGVDAPILTSISQFLINRGYLTDKQKVLVRKKLVKYNKQLTKLANA